MAFLPPLSKRALLALSLAGLSACSQEPTPPAPVRSVKIETAERGSRTSAEFIGTVRRSSRAQLSFEQAGRIKAIHVDIGDAIAKGQVLAVLDPLPVQQQFARASAQLNAARAALAERQLQFNQQEAMFKDGAVAQVSLTQARAALEASKAELNSAQADVTLAQRAVDHSVIRAPFDGQVIARHSEPTVDVTAGQAILDVQGSGQTEVAADVPAHLAKVLQAGATASARQDGNVLVPLTLRSVAQHESTAGTVPVLLEAADGGAPLLPGSLIHVLVQVDNANKTLTVPLSSLVPSSTAGAADVFVFSAAHQTVKKVRVRVGSYQGSQVEILGGLAEDAVIVTAGASYLTDGQKVRPYKSQSQLGQGETR